MKAYRHVIARAGGVLLLACAFVTLGAARADAGLKLWVCDDAACSGGGDTLVDDGGAGDLDLATTGSILVNLGGGQIQTALSYPAAGSPSRPFLTVKYTVFSPLYIYASQDGFTPPIANAFNFIANASSGTGSAAAFGGTSPFLPPAIFGAGALYGPQLMDFVANFAGPSVDPYFLAIGLQVLPHLGVASGDATIHVPEPATMSLFGLGLFGTALVSRRRMRKQAAR